MLVFEFWGVVLARTNGRTHERTHERISAEGKERAAASGRNNTHKWCESAAAPKCYVFNCFLGGSYYWERLWCVLRPGAHICWACGTFLEALFWEFGVVEAF